VAYFPTTPPYFSRARSPEFYCPQLLLMLVPPCKFPQVPCGTITPFFPSTFQFLPSGFTGRRRERPFGQKSCRTNPLCLYLFTTSPFLCVPTLVPLVPQYTSVFFRPVIYRSNSPCARKFPTRCPLIFSCPSQKSSVTFFE